MRAYMLGVVAGSLALAGCATVSAPSASNAIGGTLMLASGQPVGTVAVTPTTTGFRITVNAGPMAPGTYGIHIHSVGKCEGPAFASAGAHWNPTARQHGLMNPAGHHSGDLPNLLIGADGTGSVAFDVPGRVDGADGLLDADGAAVVIHAGPDDNVTDPSGNSGARVACAVIAHG